MVIEQTIDQRDKSRSQSAQPFFALLERCGEVFLAQGQEDFAFEEVAFQMYKGLLAQLQNAVLIEGFKLGQLFEFPLIIIDSSFSSIGLDPAISP